MRIHILMHIIILTEIKIDMCLFLEAENPLTTATSHTTSFESRSDASVTGIGSAEPFTANIQAQTAAINILSSEERRTCYRSILAQRLRVNI